MAVRVPFYWNGTELQEMSSADIIEWQDRAIYEYSLSTTSTLTVVASGGNLGTITDTRTAAGAFSTNVTTYPSEATTAEPTTVTVSYSKVQQTLTTGGSGQIVDNGTSYPLYNDGNNFRSMPLADMLDTFIYPAIDKMILSAESSTTAGTYTVSASSSIANNTLVSATPIFLDTRANTGAYTAAGIPEALDQPTTITNYYLHRRNGVLNAPAKNLMFLDGSGDAQEYTTAAAAALLGNWLRHTAATDVGNRINYNIGSPGAGNVRGTNMSNTKLNGSGNYTIRFVNSNDYRAQEFPNGTAVVVNTYSLGISKA
jgi:hypothetical protein